jgi:lipid II:glycine glycyltransferase (peptidoglycan interpeptide bridge formation enzyme)
LEYGRARRWRYAEFRGENRLSGEASSQTFIQHNLYLSPNETGIQSKFRKSVLRNIQKAAKEGVSVEIRYDVGGIISFYQLHCLTRKRQGLPPQAKKFFLNLHKYVIAHGLGYTAVAYHGPTVIAGLVCLRLGKNAIYKYGASDENFQGLRANNLLFWEMIRKCAEEGCETLSLGRTDLRNEGLMVFKDGWGGQRSALNYYRYYFKLGRFVVNGGGPSGYEAALKRLPVWLLRLFGYLCYPHMG